MARTSSCSGVSTAISIAMLLDDLGDEEEILGRGRRVGDDVFRLAAVGDDVLPAP